jgi:hypothetical protein
MTIKYVNSKERTYYLHQSQTKTGKSRYHFSMKNEGASKISKIPDGYEIYEHPTNAQVFLRKSRSQTIKADEKKMVEEGMKKYSDIKFYKIDIKEEAILIYTPDQDVDALISIFDKHLPIKMPTEKMGDVLKKTFSYSPELRFILTDKENRRFTTQRFCYLDSVEDWIPIGYPDNLEVLIEAYLPHLGKESLFE